MIPPRRGRKRLAWLLARQAAAGVALVVSLSSCGVGQLGMANRLEENARLIEEVKTFGGTLGIIPTEALRRSVEERSPLSMLWLWMQREGTLAVRAPVDIRMAIGFATTKENLRLEQVYRVAGYSVYWRQGNEFADARSVTTAGFAEEAILRRVKVILHEDLHGDENFALPWEVEESIVTPLGTLAMVEFFRVREDRETAQLAQASLEEEIKYAQELNAVVAQAEKLFKDLPIEDAKRQILNLISSYPLYDRYFRDQIADQHPPTVLEAKLSHDLAYYRYFDQIAALSNQVGDLKTLIDDLKKIPPDSSPDAVQAYLQELKIRYGRSPI